MAVIDDAMFEFLCGPNAMLLGTRDRHNVPAITRPIGCQVCPDREQVMAFLVDARAIAHIRETGVLAIVVVRPTTYEGYQLKATDAQIKPLSEAERATVAANRERLLDEMVRVGLTRESAELLTPRVEPDVVAAVFSPTAIYLQTPGPGAGEPRES
jgi:hypothetical protein